MQQGLEEEFGARGDEGGRDVGDCLVPEGTPGGGEGGEGEGEEEEEGEFHLLDGMDGF